MTTVQILLAVHILAALVAVGATVSYFFWLRRAVLVPESRSFTLETIRLLERRMVTPAYVIVLLTGLGLIDRASWGWSTPWLELSILLFIVLMGLVGVHARVIKGQIALAEKGRMTQQTTTPPTPDVIGGAVIALFTWRSSHLSGEGRSCRDRARLL